MNTTLRDPRISLVVVVVVVVVVAVVVVLLVVVVVVDEVDVYYIQLVLSSLCIYYVTVVRLHDKKNT